MKVKILSDFRDKYDYSRLYKAGDVVKFDKERGNELIRLGLAESFKEKEAEEERGEEGEGSEIYLLKPTATEESSSMVADISDIAPQREKQSLPGLLQR